MNQTYSELQRNPARWISLVTKSGVNILIGTRQPDALRQFLANRQAVIG